MKFFALLLLAGTVLLTTSCEKDEIPARQKFLGSYQVNENCNSGSYTYSMTVVESATSDDGIIMQNFGNFQSTINVNATVNNENISFNVTQDGVTVTGSGTITGNTLTVIYQTSGGFDDNCTATCIKQ